MHITDEVFGAELDTYLKKTKTPAKDRRGIILYELEYSKDRDATLEQYRRDAVEHSKRVSEAKAVPSELKEQCDFIEWFRKNYPNDWCFEQRNSGSRTPLEKVQQVASGVQKGVSDLFAPRWMLFIEFKRSNGTIKDQKPDQARFEDYVTKHGYTYFLAFGFKDAKSKFLQHVEMFDKAK